MGNLGFFWPRRYVRRAPPVAEAMTFSQTHVAGLCIQALWFMQTGGFDKVGKVGQSH